MRWGRAQWATGGTTCKMEVVEVGRGVKIGVQIQEPPLNYVGKTVSANRILAV